MDKSRFLNIRYAHKAHEHRFESMGRFMQKLCYHRFKFKGRFIVAFHGQQRMKLTHPCSYYYDLTMYPLQLKSMLTSLMSLFQTVFQKSISKLWHFMGENVISKYEYKNCRRLMKQQGKKQLMVTLSLMVDNNTFNEF